MRPITANQVNESCKRSRQTLFVVSHVIPLRPLSLSQLEDAVWGELGVMGVTPELNRGDMSDILHSSSEKHWATTLKPETKLLQNSIRLAATHDG